MFIDTKRRDFSEKETFDEIKKEAKRKKKKENQEKEKKKAKSGKQYSVPPIWNI